MKEFLVVGLLLADIFFGFYRLDRTRTTRSTPSGGQTTSDVRIMDDMCPPPKP